MWAWSQPVLRNISRMALLSPSKPFKMFKKADLHRCTSLINSFMGMGCSALGNVPCNES